MSIVNNSNLYVVKVDNQYCRRVYKKEYDLVDNISEATFFDGQIDKTIDVAMATTEDYVVDFMRKKYSNRIIKVIKIKAIGYEEIGY